MKQNIEIITKKTNKALVGLDVTDSQVRILFYLIEMKSSGPVSQTEIMNFMAIKHPTLVGLLKRLEQKGFIKQEKSEEDKRVLLVSVTKKAHTIKEDLKKRIGHAHKDIYSGFSKDEIQSLLSFMKRINHNLKI